MNDDDKIGREVWGYTHDGKRVHLGNVKMSDNEVGEFLETAAEIYGTSGAVGWFNVRSAVFDLKAFAGVQVLPPVEEPTQPPTAR